MRAKSINTMRDGEEEKCKMNNNLSRSQFIVITFARACARTFDACNLEIKSGSSALESTVVHIKLNFEMRPGA